MRTVLVVAALVVGCGGSDLDKAVAHSKAVGDRPLVVMATAEWCGPCHLFKKVVLPLPAVQKALGDVEFVMLDEARSKGSLRALGVDAYPTFMVVRPGNQVVASFRGVAPAEQFIRFLHWAAPNFYTKTTLEAQLAATPTTRMRVHAARWYTSRDMKAQGVDQYRQALARLDQGESWRRAELSWELVLAENRGGDRVSVGASARHYVSQFPGAPEALEAARLALLVGSLDDQLATTLGHQLLAAAHDDAGRLNELTYLFLAAKLTHLALLAAQRLVTLTPADPGALDTLAEAHNYNGNTAEAIAAADRALAAVDTPGLRRTLEANRKRYQSGGPSGDVAAQTRMVMRTLKLYGVR